MHRPNFIVLLLVILAYSFVGFFVLDLIFYEMFAIKRTLLTGLLEIVILFGFWFGFFRNLLFPPPE